MFLALHLELNRSLLFFCAPLRLPVLSLLWIAMCVFLLYAVSRCGRANVLLALLAVFVAGMVVKLFFFDLRGVERHGRRCCYGGHGLQLPRRRRCGCWISAPSSPSSPAATICCCAGSANARTAAYAFGARGRGAAVRVPHAGSQHVPVPLRAGSAGRRRVDPLVAVRPGADPGRHVEGRPGACATWGWRCSPWWPGRCLLSDLAHLEQVYRIIAFIVLGILVLSGSFVYLKCRPMLAAEKERRIGTMTR